MLSGYKDEKRNQIVSFITSLYISGITENMANCQWIALAENNA